MGGLKTSALEVSDLRHYLITNPEQQRRLAAGLDE